MRSGSGQQQQQLRYPTLSPTCTSSRGSPSHSHPHSSDDELSLRQAVRDLDYLDPDPRHLQNLVLQFGAGDATAVERWLSALDAGWVLHLAGDDVASQGRLRPLRHFARRWSVALTRTIDSVLHAVEDDEEVSNHGQEGDNFEEFRLLSARFMEETVLKMLPFVTVIRSAVAAEAGVAGGRDGWATAAADKLQALVELTDPMDRAKDAAAVLRIRSHSSRPRRKRSHSSLNPNAKSIAKAVEVLEDAIFHAFGEIKDGLITSSEDEEGAEILQTSPQVDNITRSVIKCIILLWRDRRSLHTIAQKAYEVDPWDEETTASATSLIIMDIVSFLEVKLPKMSQSFPDQGLWFLFLLNNTYFMWSQLRDNLVPFLPPTHFPHKIDDYIQKYLQVSWDPVLSCLHDPAPQLCLNLARPSPLLKFESEFHKTYTAQKLWRVPDPNLRRELREAIIEKVTSGLTKYLEDNNITTPRVTPWKVEEMLEELFEG